MRSALVSGDDVLGESSFLDTIKPVGEGVVCGVPTDEDVVPFAVSDVAVAQPELIAEAARRHRRAGVEEVGMVLGNITVRLVLQCVERDAQAVLDADGSVTGAISATGEAAARIALQNECDTIAAFDFGAEINIERNLEVVREVNALVEHDGTSFLGSIRSQREGVMDAIVGGCSTAVGFI